MFGIGYIKSIDAGAYMVTSFGYFIPIFIPIYNDLALFFELFVYIILFVCNI